LIHVAAGTYKQAGITVDRNITILGEGADGIILQAAVTPPEASGHEFEITPSYNMVIKDLMIHNGFGAGSGAGILVDGSSLSL